MTEASSILNELKDYYSSKKEVPTGLRDRVLGEIEVIKIFLDFNDTEKMIEHAEIASQFLNENVSSVVYRQNKFTFGVPHFLYTYYREAGKLNDTVRSILRGFPPRVFDGCGIGCEFVALAEVALEQAEIENVQLNIRKAIYKANTMKQYCIIISAKFAEIRLYLLKGDSRGALEQLKNLKAWYTKQRSEMTALNYDFHSTTIDMCEGYVYGCLKMGDDIPKWIRDGELDQGRYLLNGLAFPCILYGKSVMLTENWVKLEILCESHREKYEKFHNQLGIIHNTIYEAVAKFHLYGREQGCNTLLIALLDAQKDNLILVFAENAYYILPMLYELKDHVELETSYITKLIFTCEQYCKCNFSNKKANILSKRETEVLKLMVNGLTQQEIAKDLFLSVSSIKRNIESIYKKLEVNNKQKAIKKATEKKLI